MLLGIKQEFFCSKYFKKGQQVGIVGRLETRNYDDKDGKRVYVTEVIAEEAYFADSNRAQEENPFANNEVQGAAKDEDLPF